MKTAYLICGDDNNWSDIASYMSEKLGMRELAIKTDKIRDAIAKERFGIKYIYTSDDCNQTEINKNLKDGTDYKIFSSPLLRMPRLGMFGEKEEQACSRLINVLIPIVGISEDDTPVIITHKKLIEVMIKSFIFDESKIEDMRTSTKFKIDFDDELNLKAITKMNPGEKAEPLDLLSNSYRLITQKTKEGKTFYKIW